MKKPKLIVLQFPGSNCEYETHRAASYYGFESRIVRWNSLDEIDDANAIILPGGFSYQDRVRSGAISSKLPILKKIIMKASSGVPVLGICNGCQILAEAGLIAGVNKGQVEIGMAPNTRDGRPVGFICDWKYLVVKNPKRSVFTQYYDENEVLPIPVNHGEGRFVVSKSVSNELINLASFRYSDHQGVESTSFPINHNGASYGLAAISNVDGNVMGMMPHPERAARLRQIPVSISGEWREKKRQLLSGGSDGVGPSEKLFVGMRDAARETQ